MLPLTLAAPGAEPDAMSHVLPHTLAGWFTNHHLMSLVVLIGGIGLLLLVAKKMPISTGEDAENYVTKSRLAQLFETLCVFLRDEMTRPLLGKLTDKYIYYVWSTFFFILFANLLGLIPLGSLSGVLGFNSHIGGTLTGNIFFTAGLAVVAFVMMFLVALRENTSGFFKHMWVVPMKPVWLAPLMIIIGLFIFILELVISPVIRAFALAVRLFANMVAGHLIFGSLVIMATTASSIWSGIPAGLGAVAFGFMELFVAFLQAYIFCFLVVIFISLGAVHHDEHDEHEGGLDEGEMPGEAVADGLSGTTSAHH